MKLAKIRDIRRPILIGILAMVIVFDVFMWGNVAYYKWVRRPVFEEGAIRGGLFASRYVHCFGIDPTDEMLRVASHSVNDFATTRCDVLKIIATTKRSAQ